LAFAAALALGSPACRRSGSPASGGSALTTAEADGLRRALLTYANIAQASYADAADGARNLLATIESFVTAPTSGGLAEARRAWLAARPPYQQTETFRFYDGPIDAVEMRVNTWPIDESYVDGDGRAGKLGVVADTARYPALTSELVSELNVKEGETSVSTGYHVIEYLLWGKDTHADGPGDRPHTDFVAGTDPLAARRGQYLALVTRILVADLETVRDAWAPDRQNYRARFLALPPAQALGLVIKGMGALSGSELAGERLTVAYATKAQENEHSCFSDNTVNDLADDALGIRNVCAGRYVRANGASVSGAGICDAITLRDRPLADRLRAAVTLSYERVRAIPAPFDQAMLGNDDAPGRVAIRGAIDALQAEANTLAEVAAAFGLRTQPAAPSP
jgi:putative iron-regulated protein